MKPTLLILAAGMGSRYGKLKQMDTFGPNGETIIDYSLYDAINAGFGKAVFIIRDAFREEFEAFFRKKLEGKIELEFVSQELSNLPSGCVYNEERTKPWGTAHAVWVAHQVISEPFGVINADDYYGTESFHQLANYLKNSHENHSLNYSVIAYYLRNTLSDHGTVNRGICSVSTEKHLIDVTERTKIQRNDSGIIQYPIENGFDTLEENTLVSMNMWGFLPSYFTHCEKMLTDFIKNEGHLLTSEFYIPSLIDKLIKDKALNVDVMDTESDWFGVTYQEDKPYVMEKISKLIHDGVYPENLWK